MSDDKYYGHVDPRKFWEEKIIGWEEGRYGQSDKGGLLEAAANRASRSLRFRIKIAGELLAPHVSGKKVVELGCGSGLLAPVLMQAGAESYLGLDIAENAIDAANDRARELGLPDTVGFKVARVADLDDLDADLVFSLGLLDWLSDDELEKLFRVSGQAHFLHAIAEKRFSIFQWLHRLYVQLAYGHRTGSYRPRYFTAKRIAELAQAQAKRPAYVYRDPRLSFGALVSSLPVGEALDR